MSNGQKALLVLAALGLLLASPLLFIDEGDWLGPAERGIRAALNGWDMWDTPAVRPYQEPMPARVPGTVSISGKRGFGQALAGLQGVDAQALAEGGKLAYERFCDHCHGPRGDARVVVGESFDVYIVDLPTATPDMEDEDIYDIVMNGSGAMLALGETVSPTDALRIVRYLRTLER